MLRRSADGESIRSRGLMNPSFLEPTPDLALESASGLETAPNGNTLLAKMDRLLPKNCHRRSKYCHFCELIQ